MSFEAIATEIKKSGFDPRKDKVNAEKKLPAGIYTVMLTKAIFNVSDKGWESLGYEFEVKDGDFKGEKEFATFGLMDEWNGKNLKRLVERSIKFFQKAVYLADDKVLKRDYVDGVSLQEALNRKAVGSYFNLLITESEYNGKIYRNYDLEECADNEKTVDMNDFEEDDLPF